MLSGVLAHQMSPSQAQLLANSNISWVSGDVTFNPSDISQWSQIYSLAQQNHLSLMGILDQHLMNYSNTFTLADWSNAVNQAVAAFGGFVKTWEIWNEPNYSDSALGYYNGSAQAYVAMLQTAYSDIKAAASSDTVIGLGGMPLYDSENQTVNIYTQQAFAWATQVVQLGGMNYCDAIAVHAYPYGQYLAALAGSSFSYYTQQYQQLCGKPIWVTEVGTESFSTTWQASETAQSQFLSQSYSLFQGLGVKAYMWYELCDNYTAIPNSNFGLFSNNGNQKQAFDTFAAVANGSPTPTAMPTAIPTTTPSIAPTSSLSLSQTPKATALTQTPSTKPTSIPEENSTAALIIGLGIAVAAAISVKVKKFGHEKN